MTFEVIWIYYCCASNNLIMQYTTWKTKHDELIALAPIRWNSIFFLWDASEGTKLEIFRIPTHLYLSNLCIAGGLKIGGHTAGRTVILSISWQIMKMPERKLMSSVRPLYQWPFLLTWFNFNPSMDE